MSGDLASLLSATAICASDEANATAIRLVLETFDADPACAAVDVCRSLALDGDTLRVTVTVRGVGAIDAPPSFPDCTRYPRP